jgi:hypothetical protein
MTNISCSAKNCAYNKNMACYKHKINVEGLFSRSKLGTFCESFKTPKEKVIFETEFASDMQSEALSALETKTEITCSANYCLYNKNSRCSAENIKVGSADARFRSETECDSFTLK